MKHTVTLTALAATAVLGLAACGGGGAHTAPSAGHSASSSPAAVQPATGHTAQPGEPALIAVPGYDYANVPAGGLSAKELIKSDPQHLKSGSAHVVLHEGNMIGALALIQVKHQYAQLPGLRQAMTSSFVQQMAGSGATVTKQTIHTQPVTIAKKGSTVTYCWYHGDTVSVVTGDNAQQIHDFAEAYLQVIHP